jgi:hypothetical protein
MIISKTVFYNKFPFSNCFFLKIRGLHNAEINPNYRKSRERNSQVIIPVLDCPSS